MEETENVSNKHINVFELFKDYSYNHIAERNFFEFIKQHYSNELNILDHPNKNHPEYDMVIQTNTKTTPIEIKFTTKDCIPIEVETDNDRRSALLLSQSEYYFIVYVGYSKNKLGTFDKVGKFVCIRTVDLFAVVHLYNKMLTLLSTEEIKKYFCPTTYPGSNLNPNGAKLLYIKPKTFNMLIQNINLDKKWILTDNWIGDLPFIDDKKNPTFILEFKKNPSNYQNLLTKILEYNICSK